MRHIRAKFLAISEWETAPAPILCKSGDFSPGVFLPAAKPSGPRTVRVVVVVVGVVGGSSLSGPSTKHTTKLRLYEFTSGWDPD